MARFTSGLAGSALALCSAVFSYAAAPTCSISSNTSSVTVGQSFILTASGADGDGNLHYLNIDQLSPNSGYYGSVTSGNENPPSNGFYDLGADYSSYSRNLTLTISTPGSYVFRTAACDGSSWSYSSSTTVVVNPPNHPPSCTVSTNKSTMYAGDTVVVSVAGSDQDGNLRYVNVDQTAPTNGYYGPGDTGNENPPNNGAYDIGGNYSNYTRNLTLTLNVPGTYTFRGAVNDATGWVYSPSNVSVTVNPANHAPLATSLSVNNTSPGQTTTLSGSATDTDGNLQYLYFYVNPPNLTGWQFVGAANVSGSSASGSVNWTPPSNAMTGTWLATIRAIDANSTWDSNNGITQNFSVKLNQSVSSQNSSCTVNVPFTPPYWGGAGAGSWQFVIGAYTNWGGTQTGTLLPPNNTPSASWTPTSTGTYQFWITKLGDNDYYDAPAAGPYTLTVNLPADTSPPSAPTTLSAKDVTSTSFTLNWNASSDNVGVTLYEVQRSGTSVGTTSGTSMVVTGLSANTIYSMTVRARDAAGNWSAWSSPLNVTTSAPPDTTAPSVPGGLSATSITTSSFTLNWVASSDNVGVTAYEVMRSGASLGTTASTSMPITGLSASTTYTMTVRARDAAGNWSAWNSGLGVTTAAPQPPPSITSPLTASGTVGSTFGNYTITATNSPTTYGASNLPPGLSLSGATISGTPTTVGTYNSTISATNSAGSGSATLTITITAAAALNLNIHEPIAP